MIPPTRASTRRIGRGFLRATRARLRPRAKTRRRNAPHVCATWDSGVTRRGRARTSHGAPRATSRNRGEAPRRRRRTPPPEDYTPSTRATREGPRTRAERRTAARRRRGIGGFSNAVRRWVTVRGGHARHLFSRAVGEGGLPGAEHATEAWSRRPDRTPTCSFSRARPARTRSHAEAFHASSPSSTTRKAESKARLTATEELTPPRSNPEGYARRHPTKPGNDGSKSRSTSASAPSSVRRAARSQR